MSSRQLTMLLTLHYWGSALLGLPSMLIGLSGKDAWVPILLGMLLQMLILPLFVAIFSQMNGDSVGVFLTRAMGKAAGKLMLALYIIFVPFLINILTLRSLGDFTSNDLYIETPPPAIYALILFALVYSLYKGFTAVSRSAEITFPIVFALLLMLLLSLLPGADWSSFLPMFEQGAEPLFKGTAMFMAYPYSEVALSLFLAPFIKNKQSYKKALIHSTWITGIALLLLTVLIIAVLGESIPPNIPYASQFAAKTVTIGGFYERIETVVTVIWFIVIFYRLILTLFISALGFAELFGLKQHLALLPPLALVTITLAMNVWDNSSVIAELNEIWYLNVFFFNLLCPLIWYTAHKLRNRNK
ncbi:endospore germination permease [Paenibacillus sp. S150]|uniref:GerAB/ArcD/ProY family transporter n=1 Tax=Paenibacillus sp. S150 TaxID=2749826 RepID=UPI001C592A04|nr:endospore germination permease [Paenibacillus sp. S150]MBW4083033.1 endospore germination permease [Paenibacillus sp. S150]